MKNFSVDLLLEHCIKNKKSLTPTRLLIIKTLFNHTKPLSAYELQNEINNTKVNLNISTIYRVLEFWIKIGVLHKITSLNKYFVCTKPKDKHIHMLNFCTKCNKVYESCNKAMKLNFDKSVASLKLSMNKQSPIEIPVLCSNCE